MNTTTIENTKAFSALDSVTKVIYRRKNMMDKVRNEFNVAKEVGIEKYNELYNPRPYVLAVIKELL